ncbi:MAG: MFS transporter [Saprospiraceae bacterium]|nr:MFS transporter [Saprospiraceae bacterium]
MSLRRLTVFYYLYSILSSLDFTRGIFVLFLLHRGFSHSDVGLFQSILFFSILVFEVPTGVFADSYRRKWSLTFGMVILAIAFFGVLLANEADDSKIESLVQAAKEQDISVVPTQSLMTRWLAPQAAELLVQEPEMKYISPSLRYSWRQNKEQMLDRLQYTPEQYNRFIELRHKLLRSFIEHNVPVLLGSDAPQVFNVPGFSIHHEIQSLFDAGLSNFQVLKAGTINVASFFQADDRGVVAPGKIADLVLLAGNPLADIKNTKQINAVIYRGKLLSHKEIEEGLQKISDKYNSDSK